jgi:hypothetical protein
MQKTHFLHTKDKLQDEQTSFDWGPKNYFYTCKKKDYICGAVLKPHKPQFLFMARTCRARKDSWKQFLPGPTISFFHQPVGPRRFNGSNSFPALDVLILSSTCRARKDLSSNFFPAQQVLC